MKSENLPATKILASIRTKGYSKNFFEEIIKAGATLFRYNFSFINLERDDENIRKSIEALRKSADNLGFMVGIAADIPGPALKTIISCGEDINLKQGEKIVFYEDSLKGISIKHECRNLYEQLEHALKERDLLILIDHAHAVLSVKSINIKRKEINAVAVNDALIRHNKNISFPGCYLLYDPISSADRKRLDYIVRKDFDFIFQSYAQCREGVKQMKGYLATNNASDKLVVVKVETDYAVKEKLDEIVEESDGVIIARGHLADELSERLELPIYQRKIISSAKKHSKPVILATELYYSMVDSYYPNRPDMENVFSAVADNVDAMFLSGETTNSKDPCRIVKTLAKQLRLTEEYFGTGQIERPTFSEIKAARNAILRKGVYPEGVLK